MKEKIYIIVVLFFILGDETFAQSTTLFHRSLEYRFNSLSIEYQIRGTGEYPIYFFYGFDNFSNAIIWQNTAEYPHWLLKHFWTLQISQRNGNHFITFGGGYPENNGDGRIPNYESFCKTC